MSKLYPIIPIHLSYSFIQQQQQDDSSLSSLSPVSIYLIYFLHALATQVSLNLPEQTNEIITLLQDPHSKIEIRKLKKTSYSYQHVPKKIRDSISNKYPTTLGTSCGIVDYGLIRIYIFEEESYASKWGFHKGDLILDTRTYTPCPQQSQNRNRNQRNRTPKKPWEQEEVEEKAVRFILPIETHCVPGKMQDSLSDFIGISLMPLSVSVSRMVESNHAGGLEAFPQWNGVVVSPEIRDALSSPSGAIYRHLEEKWGVRLQVERSTVCPEVVEKSGMVLLTRIWW